MKLFGHHVTRLFLASVALDASLFLGALYMLRTGQDCSGCYLPATPQLNSYQTAGATGGFLLLATSLGLYNNDASRDFRTFCKRAFLLWQFILIAAVAFLAIYSSGRLRLGHEAWFAIAVSLALILGLCAVHLALVWCFGLPFMKKAVVVLGDGPFAKTIVEFLEGPGRTHFRHLATIGNWRTGSLPPRVGNVVLKPQEDQRVVLAQIALSLHATEIIVAVDERRALPVSELLECRLAGIRVVDALAFWERETGQIDPVRVGEDWLTFEEGFAFDRPHRLVKRLLDLVVSATLLIVMLPVMILTAVAIKLESPGPVFYRQERVGLNGRVFKLWKFRSMRTDAERDGVPRWAGACDDRVTRVGRFIRKVRIDELPQVINVLAGEMSFIGPRPERPFFVEQLREAIPHYDLRHRVRPGITGWAQVNYPYGASAEDAARKLSYDLYYLKKNDLLLDVAILVQTVRVILFAHGSR